MKQVKVTVKMELPEMVRMIKHIHLGQHPRLQSLFILLSFTAGIGAGFTLYDPRLPILSFYFLGMLPILYFVVLPFFFLFQAKNTLTQNEVLSSPLHYSFSEKGIMTQNSQAQNLIKWDQLERVFDSSQDLIFYLTKTFAFSLPKAQLAGKLELVNQIIDENLDSSKLM
ncbi:MAG: YcxB family protein [SAR324 cluster bacterium]|nr:YcxB family protein [SAR324 cluster bacterium]